MQTGYRPPFPQQPPQRSPHAASSVARSRGIGPMVQPHPQSQLTPAQAAAQRAAESNALDKAKRRAEKPTDKNMPEGVEDCIVGDGVQQYRELRDIERRLDAIMMRKRLDIQESVNRNVKCERTLRVWISNTVEDQPWQSDTLDMDAFDFSTNMDSSYRVKIEGRLLDDEEDDGENSDSSDDEEEPLDPDAMDEDGKEKKKKSKLQGKQYKLSHFFKAMTVDFDRNKGKDGQEQSVEWKKPTLGPNAANLPNSADFDQLEFKRGGDENQNITINLFRDESPEKFALSPLLHEIMDTTEATRAEVVMGIWDYIRAKGLQGDDEKRSFECDERLKAIFHRDQGYIPFIPDSIVQYLSPLPPIKLPYTIRVDQAFHADPQPTIYDIRVTIDDPLKTALQSYLTNPSYASSLHKISETNDAITLLIRRIGESKSKHAYFEALAKNPTEFFAKWISSQKRDLEIIGGEAQRGGGEGANSDEWRAGGKRGVWGSEHVRQSVNLIVGAPKRA